MQEVIADTFEHAGLTVEIVYDPFMDEDYNPRQYDQLGTMACWHPRYDLGDESFTRESYPDATSMQEVGKEIQESEGAVAILPLYLYDHSGISMTCGAPNPFDSGGWDTTACGFIYTTKEQIEKLCGAPDYVPKDYAGTQKEWIAEQLAEEVAEYNLYLTQDGGGYRVLDSDGEEIESCWGFLGLDGHVVDEAKSAAEYAAKAATK